MSRLAEVLPRRVDLKLLGAALLLTAVGIAMVVSTTAGTPRGDLGGRQAIFAALGLAGAGLLLAIDYRILLQYSPGLYGAGLGLLAYVLVFGKRVAGTKGWITIAGFGLQPAEVARVATAVLLAWILENDDRPYLQPRTVGAILLACGAPMALILLQPDLGVALTYAPLLLGALYFGGLKSRVWAVLLVTGVLAAGSSWFFLKEYQKDRIRTFLNPTLESRGAGYQVRQARIAIGSGGIVGKGWQKGSQSRLGFLPVRHTDFVFAALAEEWGFVGVAAVLGLFAAFLGRSFALARDARDRGGAMLVLLLTLAIACEAIVNVSMNVGLLPTTGITLPFVSYGGSSLLATWSAVGLLLSVSYRRFVNV